MVKEYADDIRAAVQVLRKGGVILYPTDTVWGLGCDATNAAAVERVYSIKRRSEAKALITLVADLATLERTVDGIPDVAYDLVTLADKPLTVIYDRARGVAANIKADDGSLAVRMTSEPFSNALCRSFGRPLVSTSANISGRPTPAVFADIDPDIVAAVDYVCTSRRTDGMPHKASTIIKLSEDGCFKIIRP